MMYNVSGNIYTFRVSIAASQMNHSDVFVKDLQYSLLLGGFAVVLSNGKAAFLTANTLKFEPTVSSILFGIHEVVSSVNM